MVVQLKKIPRFYYPDVKLLVIDLFCGAGGTTIGFEKAFSHAKKLAKVIACVNHDKNAIASHKANHSRIKHFNEDIRTLELTELLQLIKEWRLRCPNAKVVLWASLDCTQHSRAKGGLPKIADSRTLAWELYRYIESINPDYIQIENVVEFKIWGPLDDEMHPIKEEKGVFFEGWRHHIREYGYRDEWAELNAANYGGYTTRTRLFGCFAKEGLPIIFPAPTHTKVVGTKLKMWKPVKDILDFTDIGESIFSTKYVQSRKITTPRISSTDTFERIYAGLLKYTPKKATASITPLFLASYYNGSKCVSPLISPAPTLTTKDRLSMVTINKQSAEPFLMTAQYSITSGLSSVHRPSTTLIASMNKTETKLVSSIYGSSVVTWDKFDTPIRKKIKAFMIANDIQDICMRGLRIPELKSIQGFPVDYVLKGSQAEQKKYIGNSVHCSIVIAWVKELVKVLHYE